jgi:hypothetical protein
MEYTGQIWINMKIVSNLVDTFDEDFLENITNKKFLEPCVGMGVLFSHF